MADIAAAEDDKSSRPSVSEASVKTPTRNRRLVRGNPFLRERVHDPYRAHEKLRDASGCPVCGARYRNGRWAWPQGDVAEFRSEICPACSRIEDRYPAGELILAGEFLGEHIDEVLSTARHVAERERTLHPLHRLMAVEAQDGEVTLYTTDVHLPHRMAHALKDAWGGSVRTHYDRDGYYARLIWRRDD
jgi:hypothetical protein